MAENKKVIDTTDVVYIKCTKEAPFHSDGDIIKVAPAVAEKMVAKKWGVKVDKPKPAEE